MEGSLLEWVAQTLSNTSLESLEIRDCPTMKIPVDCCYNFLLSLNITSSCDSLRTFPLDFFPKLQSLYLEKCSNLEAISQEHERDLSLILLEIFECPKFVYFPKAGFSAPSLERLYIFCLENLKSLPECMHTLFPSLTHLYIYDCPQLESFCDEGLPSSLKYMDLRSCSKLLIASLKCALGINSSLKGLKMYNVDVESFPDPQLLPLSLTSLDIRECVNLKKLDYKGLCQLSSLHKLNLSGCPSLESLPVEGLPKSISTLIINDCSLLLKQWCMEPKGEDWVKISHIQEVIIDGVKIT